MYSKEIKRLSCNKLDQLPFKYIFMSDQNANVYFYLSSRQSTPKT